MTNEEKANELIAGDESINISTVRLLIKDKVLQMAKWKDEQTKNTIIGVWLSSIMCQDHTLSNKDHQYIDLDELKNILEDFFHIKLEEE